MKYKRNITKLQWIKMDLWKATANSHQWICPSSSWMMNFAPVDVGRQNDPVKTQPLRGFFRQTTSSCWEPYSKHDSDETYCFGNSWALPKKTVWQFRWNVASHFWARRHGGEWWILLLLQVGLTNLTNSKDSSAKEGLSDYRIPQNPMFDHDFLVGIAIWYLHTFG